MFVNLAFDSGLIMFLLGSSALIVADQLSCLASRLLSFGFVDRLSLIQFEFGQFVFEALFLVSLSDKRTLRLTYVIRPYRSWVQVRSRSFLVDGVQSLVDLVVCSLTRFSSNLNYRYEVQIKLKMHITPVNQ
ncbi:hypothetical protein ACH5RR_006639 [Cinchona calisaya]|uniref:Secreted protein n=1 Tax=Cinchona calisaya TaxID=153742 RepID=A0ABD3APW4_9GENT